MKNIDADVIAFGRSIFEALEGSSPGAFNSRFWHNKLMSWSMERPELKTNLFRLVDVLPTLKSSRAIAEHVRAYLGDAFEELHPALGWGVRLSKNALIAKIASLAVKQGVATMANTLIAGDSAKSAAKPLSRLRESGFAFTADLLGEFCVCEAEAQEFLNRYLEALEVFSAKLGGSKPIIDGHPGESSPVCISVKLTALYSQLSSLNFEHSVEVLSQRLATIARAASRSNALMYVDAEDSGNNPMIYESFRRVFTSTEFKSFPYPGMVVQAYSKGSEARVKDLFQIAKERGSPVAIRLVKGAYWDLERVVCSQNHWIFPLFKNKISSDAQYEHLSRLMLDNHRLCLPAFGSHNIRSLSHACVYAESIGLTTKDYELQVLYGMADPIAEAFKDKGRLVRMYVPLGELLPGMGYLVRRLLENTSNESFLKHTFFNRERIDTLLVKPEFHPEERV